MRIAMVLDAVAAGNDFPAERGEPAGAAADAEETCRRAGSVEKIENVRRDFRVRTIVDGQGRFPGVRWPWPAGASGWRRAGALRGSRPAVVRIRWLAARAPSAHGQWPGIARTPSAAAPCRANEAWMAGEGFQGRGMCFRSAGIAGRENVPTGAARQATRAHQERPGSRSTGKQPAISRSPAAKRSSAP
jgi:hypothetical protein